MRRKEREITDIKDIRQILDTCKVIRAGLHDGEDIYILPLNYGYILEDGKLTFYMHGSVCGKKIDLIKKCANAAFEMDCDHELIQGQTACQYTYSYSSIIGKGKMELVESVKEKIEALTVLMSCQTGKLFEFNEAQAAGVSVMKLTVSEFTGKRYPIKKGAAE